MCLSDSLISFSDNFFLNFVLDGWQAGPNGSNPEINSLLFNSIEGDEYDGWNFQVKASFIEVYNDKVSDLLTKANVTVRIITTNPFQIKMDNLKEESVDSAEAFETFMNKSRQNRRTSATKGNNNSSRSHEVLRIHLTATYHSDKQITRLGSLYFVDLAGNEPLDKNKIETDHINTSNVVLFKVLA